MVERGILLPMTGASQSLFERRESSEGADVPRQRPSEGWQPTAQASIHDVQDGDTQWQLRWYPLFMAGLLLGMMAIGGFWISYFAR